MSMEERLLRFSLPVYNSIPDIGLFLDQVCKYINDALDDLPGFWLTTSMISNYVKKGMVSNPIKKQYGRDQIACLFFIAITKSVLQLEDIQLLIRLQQMTYPVAVAYDYFRTELKRVLEHVFNLKQEPITVEENISKEKMILHNTIIAVAHKVYLNQMLQLTSNIVCSE